MRSTPRLLATLMIALALPVLAGTISRSERLSLPAAGLQRVLVAGGSGRLECRGEERRDVAVELIFRAHARSRDRAERLLADCRLEVRREDEILSLEPDLPGGRAWADILLRLPRHLDLKAGVGSGELELADLDGALDLDAGSGSVRGRRLGGRVDLVLGSGEAELRDVSGSLRIKAGSGDLSLARLASCQLRGSSGDVEIFDVAGECRASTGSGDIEARRLEGDADLETGSGDIRASDVAGRLRTHSGSGDQALRGLGRPGQDLILSASSGDIDLVLLPDASFELELVTRTGEVRARVPMTVRRVSRQRLEARLGEGRQRLRIETSSGDIRIRATEERE